MGLVACGGLILLWEITKLPMLKANKKLVFNRIYLYIFMFSLYLILCLLITNKTYGELNNIYFISMFVIFAISFFIYKYYYENKDYKMLGLIALVSIICLAVGSITTLIYLEINPMLSKSITQAGMTNLAEYLKVGIGSFGFMYLVMFSLIPTIMLIFNKNKAFIKFFSILVVIVFINVLIKGGFSTAILISVFGIVYYLLPKTKNKITILIINCISVIIIVVLKNSIGKVLIDISNSLDMSKMVSQRLSDVGYFILSGDEGYNINLRIERLNWSIQSFLHNPVFGYNMVSNNLKIIKPGGHADWIDMFAFYGIIGGLPIFLFITNCIKYIIMSLKNAVLKNCYNVVVFQFIIYGFIDPFLHIYHIGFAMFLIVPSIFYLPYIFQIKEKNNESTMDFQRNIARYS